MADELPVKALSIMQPWAWLIVNRHKAIENRDWPTRYRGPVAIHAGKRIDESCDASLSMGRHPVTDRIVEIETPANWATGGIVGVADVVDCVTRSDSPWFVGRYGFVLTNQRPVPFIPVRGALGFFDWRRNIIAPTEPAPAQQRALL